MNWEYQSSYKHPYEPDEARLQKVQALKKEYEEKLARGYYKQNLEFEKQAVELVENLIK